MLYLRQYEQKPDMITHKQRFLHMSIGYLCILAQYSVIYHKFIRIKVTKGACCVLFKALNAGCCYLLVTRTVSYVLPVAA